jgi:hypothetical protein
VNFEAPEAEGESPAGEAAGGRDIWGLQTRSTCRSPASSLLLTDDDSNSYENVLVCKPSTPESGKAVPPKKGRAGAATLS